MTARLDRAGEAGHCWFIQPAREISRKRNGSRHFDIGSSHYRRRQGLSPAVSDRSSFRAIRGSDQRPSASTASPTVAEHRADDEGQESRAEAPFAGERKPRKPQSGPPRNGDHRNRKKGGNLQFISNFDVCENHRRQSSRSPLINYCLSIGEVSRYYERLHRDSLSSA